MNDYVNICITEERIAKTLEEVRERNVIRMINVSKSHNLIYKTGLYRDWSSKPAFSKNHLFHNIAPHCYTCTTLLV